METNWFKIWPSRFIGVINRIPDRSARGDILLIAFHMLNEAELKDDDAEISWVTGLDLERIQTLRPYLDRLKEKDREDGRLMFEFVQEAIDHTQAYQAYVTSLRGDWPVIRLQVLERDNWQCRYCGEVATAVDHIIARSRGGTNEMENLVAACKPCNSRKKERTPEEAGMRLIGKAVA